MVRYTETGAPKDVRVPRAQNEMAMRTGTDFIVRFNSGETQPVVATSYCVDEDCLIFLGGEEDLVAFFDLREVADWGPRFQATNRGRNPRAVDSNS